MWRQSQGGLFYDTEKEENMDVGAIFNLPSHSMPTIQSQEMLCQGTKGNKNKSISEQEQ